MRRRRPSLLEFQDENDTEPRLADLSDFMPPENNAFRRNILNQSY
jgi:hypothetical protein